MILTLDYGEAEQIPNTLKFLNDKLSGIGVMLILITDWY